MSGGDWRFHLTQEIFEENPTGFEGKVTPQKNKIKSLETVTTTTTAIRFFCK